MGVESKLIEINILLARVLLNLSFDRLILKDSFREQDHPRDDQGRFTSGAGGESRGSQYQDFKQQMEDKYGDSLYADMTDAELDKLESLESEFFRRQEGEDEDPGLEDAPAIDRSKLPELDPDRNLTTFNQINSIIDSINPDAYDYDFVGVRVVDREYDGYDSKPGDTLDRSWQWEDGEPTEEQLEGTSAIDVVDNAPSTPGGYWGNRVLIIGSYHAQTGNDPGEIVMQEPVVLDVL